MTAPNQPLPEQLSTWKRFRFRLEALGVRLLAGIVPLLPRGLVWRTGTAVGWLAYFALPVARKLAREFAAVFVPFDGIFAARSVVRPPAFWTPDGVHPSLAGHALMAHEWIKAVTAHPALGL